MENLIVEVLNKFCLNWVFYLFCSDLLFMNIK